MSRKKAPTERASQKNHQGRIYFATEYAMKPEDVTLKEFDVTMGKTTVKHKREVLRDGAEYQKGYRAVIWHKDGTRRIWSHEVPRAKMDTTPEMALARLREQALKLNEPVDLWTNMNEFVETVGA